MIQDLVAVDWSQVRMRRAASGVVAMVILVAFVGLIGDVSLILGLATLFVVAMGGDGSFGDRWPGMARYTVLGALIGGLAFLSVDSGLAVAAVMGIATYVGTLAAALGPVSARGGLFLTLWAFIAVSMGAGGADPWQASAAFLVGGAVAIGITAFRLRYSTEDEAGEEDYPEEGDGIAGERLSKPQDIGVAVRSPIGRFAVLRTIAVVLAVLLGYLWFDDHTLWAALTVLLVVKPSTGQTASIALQRTLGTAVGAGVAIVVAQVLPRGDTAVVVAFLVSAFFMLAFMNANYTVFATFLTAMLIFGQRLAEADAFEAGAERVLATILGSVIGLGLMAISIVRDRRHPADQPQG